MKKILFVFQFFLVFFVYAQPTDQQLSLKLDSLCKAGNFPGLSMAFVNKEGKVKSFVSGYNDIEKQELLSSSHLLLQGSVGKTYVSAIALMLIKNGKLNLDEKVANYLSHYTWFPRIPNAASITVRQIMNHTSGVMRYEFKPDFINDLNANPTKTWMPEELLQYVLDEKASFEAGEGWEYSDTNYILLGMIIEYLTDKKYYEFLDEQILKPFNLVNTKPTDKILLPGIAQGYAGKENEFKLPEKIINDDGSFVINPQFEWTGGGIYSTTTDLANWGKLLYEGKVIDTSLLLKEAVPAKLGPGVKYGLGVIIRNTQQGIAYGHSGFFPGYLTELYYFPEKKMCIAVQCNSSDFKNLKLGLRQVLMEFAKLIN
jgi:D-alanyl-D-alanine carboxypeptidase